MGRKLLFFFLLNAFVGVVSAQVLVPNMPAVIGDTINNTAGYITAFEHDSTAKKLYIAGQFQRVGNVNRQGFAVIDLSSGTVLNDLSFITLTDISTSNHVKARLKIFKNRLYVGGSFISPNNDYFFSVNLANNNVRSLYSLAPLSDFEIYNNKVYTSGAYYTGAAEEFDVNEMDTLGNISWTRSIPYSTNQHLSCLAARNNMLFVGGVFSSFGGVSLHNIAKVDLSTHTIANWQPAPPPGPTANSNSYEVADVVIYPNDVLLNISSDIYGNPPNNIAGYNLSSGNQNPQIRQISYTANYETLLAENDTSFWYGNTAGLKLYGLQSYNAPWIVSSNVYVSSFFRKAGCLFMGGYFSTLQGSAHTGLGVACLAPLAPKRISAFTKACQGQSNVFYMISAVKDAASYSWSYTGSGVTISGSGTSVFLNFSHTATSGTFKVCAKSYCGASGDTLYIPFTVYPLPDVNAGPDVKFTCSHTSDSLKGNSVTPGVTYAWYGPSFSSSSAVNQISNAVNGGNYVLWITDPVSGCKDHDTARVYFDTLRPAINHNLHPAQLNCANPVITLDAAALYPGSDSLHWSGNTFSQSNPASVTTAGIYTLTVTSSVNDCANTDTFSVSSNFTPPSLTAPLTLDTITCSRDSVMLSSSTISVHAILFWKNFANDTLSNDSYVHNSGAYTAHALDTSNGCGTQLVRLVNQFTTPPAVQVPPGPFSINCSFSTTVLNGSSATAGAQLSWAGPSGFASANPAAATLAGYYILSATNPQNGCTNKDSVQVILQNILLLNSCTDTIICNGSSATLSSSPIGGTPGFTYFWSNSANTNSIIASPANTTSYIVTITDNNGCTGTDTILVKVPPPLNDSTTTFQPCDPNNLNGEIQVYGTGGIAPYQYALNSGNYQWISIFNYLNFGAYTITVRDSLGCLHSSTAIIDTSSILPAPDFILATTETRTDTFVIVDISDPRPDSVVWILPAGCTIINADPFAPEIVYTDTGSLQITMHAWFGACQMQLTRNIEVIEPDTNFANEHNNNGIASLNLYPNPNSGQFTVDVTFHKKQSFAIFIFDATGNEVLRLPFTNADSANVFVNLSNSSPGAYLIKVIAEYDSRNLNFLIDQH